MHLPVKFLEPPIVLFLCCPLLRCCIYMTMGCEGKYCCCIPELVCDNVNSVCSDVSEFDPIEIFNKRCHLRLPGKCWEWQPGKKDSVEWKMGTSKNQEQQHWHKIFSRKYFLKIVLFPVAVGCHDAFILLSEMSSLWYWSLFVAHHWLRFLVSSVRDEKIFFNF